MTLQLCLTLSLFLIMLPLSYGFQISFRKISGYRLLNHHDNYNKLRSQKTDLNSIPFEVSRRLSEYLEVRRVQEPNNLNSDTAAVTVVTKEMLLARQKAQRAKEENIIISTFKPSGWFKDKDALDLAKRVDKTIPKMKHPLSFVELKRFGYEDLSESIMQLGGPFVVGESLGISWTDPESDKEVWDESLRPTRETTYALDFRGNLRLGEALEERLSLAANLDLEELKTEVQRVRQEEELLLLSPSQPRDYNAVVGDEKKKKKKKTVFVAEKRDPNRERFNLNNVQRVHLVVTSLLLSIGWGRASQDVVSLQLWGQESETGVAVVQVISFVIVIVSIVSAAASVPLSLQKNRSSGLWVAKSLLGGPDAVVRLLEAAPIVSEEV